VCFRRRRRLIGHPCFSHQAAAVGPSGVWPLSGLGWPPTGSLCGGCRHKRGVLGTGRMGRSSHPVPSLSQVLPSVEDARPRAEGPHHQRPTPSFVCHSRWGKNQAKFPGKPGKWHGRREPRMLIRISRVLFRDEGKQRCASRGEAQQGYKHTSFIAMTGWRCTVSTWKPHLIRLTCMYREPVTTLCCKCIYLWPTD
jgi:hypothetical protein